MQLWHRILFLSRKIPPLACLIFLRLVKNLISPKSHFPNVSVPKYAVLGEARNIAIRGDHDESDSNLCSFWHYEA